MSGINRGHDLKLLMWGVAAGIVGQAFIDGFDYGLGNNLPAIALIDVKIIVYFMIAAFFLYYGSFLAKRPSRSGSRTAED
jgi:hypothetical protein